LEADQVAALVIEHHFGISGIQQLIDQVLTLSPEIVTQVEVTVERLLQHEPVQYVLGHTDFYGYQFKTDARALIPRPETEELVQWVLRTNLCDQNTILDIGTGSGCIAITLALETSAQIYALDVAKEALDLARDNAQRLGASVKFMLADVMSELPEMPKFDVWVSNPPYVPRSDLGAIESRVKDYEPASALFVPDQDPLVFYHRIAELAPFHLKPGGRVFMEIYHNTGPAVLKLFQGAPWSQASIKKDLQGRDRMVTVRFEKPI
jgi:release factor glutamine methyltransferase